MGITFNDDGFGRKMKAISHTWRGKGSPMAVKETLQEALDYSQLLVPYKTGALHNSGHVVMARNGEAKGSVVYNKSYAQYIEFIIKAYLRPAMARARLAPSLKYKTANELKRTIKKVT